MCQFPQQPDGTCMTGRTAFNTVENRSEALLASWFFGPEVSHEFTLYLISPTNGTILFQVDAAVPVLPFYRHIGGISLLHDKTFDQGTGSTIGLNIDGEARKR